MKLLRWLLFTVIMGLLPIGFSLTYLMVRKMSASLDVLISRGELLLIVTAIAASGLGELIPTDGTLPKIKMIVVAACFLVVVLASAGFAMVFTTIAAGQQIDSTFVSNSSIGLFVAATLAGGASILLGGE